MDELSAKKYSEEILPLFNVNAILKKELKTKELWPDTLYVEFVDANANPYLFITSDFLREDDLSVVVEELKEQGYDKIQPLPYDNNSYCYHNDNFGIWKNFMVIKILK